MTTVIEDGERERRNEYSNFEQGHGNMAGAGTERKQHKGGLNVLRPGYRKTARMHNARIKTGGIEICQGMGSIGRESGSQSA